MPHAPPGRDEERSDQLHQLLRLDPRSAPAWRNLGMVQEALGDRAVVVLGNHDLHLLALAAGNTKHEDEHSLREVLQAPDREELLQWLQHRPLAHMDDDLGFLMVHAGIPPQWDVATTLACAREVEAVLRGDDHAEFFMRMYGNKPNVWDPALRGMDRWRFITNCLTRLRYCEPDGRVALKEKGPPGSQRAGRLPWFEHPQWATRHQRIVFGHWSTLGYRADHNVWALDTGCLWGGTLSALRLDRPDPQRIEYPCPEARKPEL